MVAWKLFIQHLFSLANLGLADLGLAEGLFVNPCENKQGVRGFDLTDLRRFACPRICERAYNKYYIKALSEGLEDVILPGVSGWRSLYHLNLHNHITCKTCCLTLVIDPQNVSHLCSKQPGRGSSEPWVDVCGHLACGGGGWRRQSQML